MGAVPAAPLPIPFPNNGLGKHQKMAQVVGLLPFTWETWKELLTLGFGPAQPWLLESSEEEISK